jgi:type VI secretion system protein ImpF
MADLRPQERLQPALLDRLTDEHPDSPKESRDQSVMTLRRLRAAVLRDLSWLLNANGLGAGQDLTDYPEVARSVVNYGLPSLSGSTWSGTDLAGLERAIRQAVWDFEPRILRHTVRVRAVRPQSGRPQHNLLSFEITGELWAQPVPEHLVLRTELDLEEGNVSIQAVSG